MPRVTRQNLGGGSLGKALQTRSDLAAYHKGNFQQENFLATLQGGMVRRFPAKWLASIQGLPSVVRGFSFIYDNTTKYSIIFAAFGDEPSSAYIFKDSGELKANVAIPYLGAHFFELDVRQVNDLMTITHQNYPPGQIARYGDTDWRYDLREIEGGPFFGQNTDRDLVMATSMSGWYEDIQYQVPNDRIFGPTLAEATATWVGTPASLNHDAVRNTELTIPEANHYYKPTEYRTVENDFFVRTWYEKFFPYILVRCDGTPTDINVGASVNIDCDFIETVDTEGNEATYVASGVVEEVYPLAGFYYLRINAGSTYEEAFFYGATVHNELKFTGLIRESVPIPEIPGSSAAGYNDGSVYKTREFYGTVNQYFGAGFLTWGDRRGPHMFMFGKDDVGGHALVAATNVLVGDSTDSYEANVPSLNITPPAAEWDTPASDLTSSNLHRIDTAGFSPFTPGEEGRLLSVQSDLAGTANGTLANVIDDVSDIYRVTGSVTVRTTNTWTGEFVMEMRPIDTSDEFWETIVEWQSSNNYNGEATRIIPFGYEIRLRRQMNGGATTVKWELDFPNGSEIIFEVVKYLDPTSVVARVLSGPNEFITSFRWSMGAFGGAAGYPAVHCIHEERLIYGSTVQQPFVMWGSEVNNWTNFYKGDTEISPITFRLLSDTVTEMGWLLSRSSRLYIGTDFGEYVASTPDKDTIISGINPPRITLATPFGSSKQRAIAMDDEVVHVTKDRLSVRALMEKEYTTTETSKLLTIMNPDIGYPLLKEIHHQRNPFPAIWALRENGTLAVFTYDVTNEVMGWAEINLNNANIQSHWIMPNDNGIDEVYFIDEREDIALNITGTGMTPDVTGAYVNDDTAKPYGLQVVGGGSTYVNQWYELSGNDQWDEADYSWQVRLFQGAWQIRITAPDMLHYKQSDLPPATRPPKTGWVTQAAGTNPAPELVYEAFGNGTYAVSEFDGTWFIHNMGTREALFESDTKFGTYTAIIGSSATGTVEVDTINFHLEKFEYASPVSTANVDFNETNYESIVEFSSLVQGANVLERNVVRCTRIIVHLVDSKGGEVSADGGATWQPIVYDDDALFTGHKEVRVNSGNVEDLRVLVRTDGLDPFHLIGVAADIENQTTGVS